ncbi:MAG: tRNA (adenosine(37)-N6)-dimethylallyltransferase MiaA [Candidatus Ryanbacteria bacterium]|nr:tRNA (adenosine(37)-N6)-dimethylallyltransferase MiaA [Candidatus Ryanbacteria bacterium]
MANEHIIVVSGPTASGKSVYAVRLAKKIGSPRGEAGGEIISADSRQVYRALDIGTAKLTKKEMRGVPHHCIDITDPRRAFSVAQYQKAALRAIDNIIKRGKTPIVVGGTGFYIDSILYDTKLPPVPPNPKLRQKLRRETSQKLLAILKKLDAARAREVDPKNPRRIIRAIEIAKALGSVPKVKKTPRFDAKIIYFNPFAKTLKKRIARRTEYMLRRGLLSEVRGIRALLSIKRMLELGFEYKYPLLYIEGKISRTEMIERINAKTWHYAKRQKTWFKKAFAREDHG